MFDLEIIGGGRMGEALLAGLLDAAVVEPDSIVVVEVDEARRAELVASFPAIAVVAAPVESADVVIATKPAGAAVAVAAAVAAGARRVLSIAAGVTTAALEDAVGGAVPVIRCMPNTPALVGRGASAIAAGAHAGADDVDWARRILGAVGVVVEVPEDQIDAVTGVSGSGPAYVFMFAEALRDAGVASGLPVDVAATLAIETIVGAAALLAADRGTPEELRAAVTSPNGTTEAAVGTLEDLGFRDTVERAVRAAADRSRELGT
ncbi:MAG: pyrroline-5-carboxylate reductase [Actinomycetes bacterium]